MQSRDDPYIIPVFISRLDFTLQGLHMAALNKTIGIHSIPELCFIPFMPLSYGAKNCSVEYKLSRHHSQKDSLLHLY